MKADLLTTLATHPVRICARAVICAVAALLPSIGAAQPSSVLNRILFEPQPLATSPHPASTPHPL